MATDWQHCFQLRRLAPRHREVWDHVRVRAAVRLVARPGRRDGADEIDERRGRLGGEVDDVRERADAGERERELRVRFGDRLEAAPVTGPHPAGERPQQRHVRRHPGFAARDDAGRFRHRDDDRGRGRPEPPHDGGRLASAARSSRSVRRCR